MANSRNAIAPITPEPRMSNDRTGSTAASEVFNERIRTWFIDTLVMSAIDVREGPNFSILSLTLSNTTIVSYNEKPKIVRKATTVAGVTSKPMSE